LEITMLTHRHKRQAFRVKLTDCQTDEFIQLWLHGKSAHTKAAYLRDIAYFQAFIESTIRTSQDQRMWLLSVKGWRSRGMRLVRFVVACMQLSLYLALGRRQATCPLMLGTGRSAHKRKETSGFYRNRNSPTHRVEPRIATK